jgi:HAMP domain-containing protein
MRLALKFNLVLFVIFGAALTAAWLIAQRSILASARDQVSQQARFMMETSASTRKYTSEHIRPILEKYQRNTAAFYPESVPAFSATQMFGYLRAVYPEYSYREATLNPTNPGDRAADWEADLINTFRNTLAIHESSGEHDEGGQPLLYLARPIKAVDTCLECHSTAAAAPPAMLNIYGPNNGFGWKLNEIVGAQIVSVPLSVPQAMARHALWRFMLAIAAFSAITILCLNIALILLVIRPLARVSTAAAELSKGNLAVQEIPVRGRDEIWALADSLNRINRSLVRAINSLQR